MLYYIAHGDPGKELKNLGEQNKIEKSDLYARIAQLVERCLAKAKVAGSSPVSRSKFLLHFDH